LWRLGDAVAVGGEKGDRRSSFLKGESNMPGEKWGRFCGERGCGRFTCENKIGGKMVGGTKRKGQVKF